VFVTEHGYSFFNFQRNMGSMNEYELQRDFMYLYERMSEPLGYGIKGSGENMVYYKMPSTEPVS
jgi:hypothetical protein